MVSGNITISASASYATEQQWRDKYGISTSDESSEQYDIDVREAMFDVRRQCYWLSRERILTMDSNQKAFLPYPWIADGDMDGDVDKSDLLIYKIDSNGRELETVNLDNVDSVDAFNNYVTFIDGYTFDTQHYVTYYVCGKPFDEIETDELMRGVIARVTIIVLDRLQLSRSLKAVSGWTAGGVSVNKDKETYKALYDRAKADYNKYVSFLKPMIIKAFRPNRGKDVNYDSRLAYSDQMFGNASRRRFRW